LAASETAAPLATPPSGAEGRKKLLVLVIVAVLIVAGLGAVAYILLSGGAPPVQVRLDRVEMTAASTTIDQRGTLAITARAIDSDGRDQTLNVSSFSWTANPAAAVQLAQPGANNSAQVTAIQTGAVSVSAVATWRGSTKTGYHNLTVVALQFELSPSQSDPLVGIPINLVVRVLRPDSTVATTYRGTLNLTADYAAVSVPANANFTAADNGVKSFTNGVTIRQPGTHTVTARDTLATTIQGTVSLFGNRAPTADIVLTNSSTNPLQVTADGRGSSDPDAGDSVQSWSWTFGDTQTGSGNVVTHTYASAGTYTISLRVTDSHADPGTATASYTARAAPVASFSVADMLPVGPDILVRVNASASTDADGTIVKYNWTWGDGNRTEVGTPEATHLYDSFWNGQTVTIALIVVDNDGIYSSSSQDVTVSRIPLPPVASFTYTVDQVNRTITVNASASSDPNGNLGWYLWNWDDGSPVQNVSMPVTSHTYAGDGAYAVNLTVVDTTLLVDWAEQTVNIQQPVVAPVAVFGASRLLMKVDVDGSASYDYNGDLTTWDWDWESDGTYDSTGSTATHTYTVPNLYTITLRVTDAGGRNSTTTRGVTVGTSTLDYSYSDFFETPYGEWWDYRTAVYGDLPINAECFSATSISTGICTPRNPAVDDFVTPPYTNWYPLPGAIQPGNPNNNPIIYAPYNWTVRGMNVGGYNWSEPVFLPVLNYGQGTGGQLDFDIRLQYLGTATADALGAAGCPISSFDLDGFQTHTTMTLTMDLQQSRRMFNVIAATPAAAQTWWNANTRPECFLEGPVESAVSIWFINHGGSSANMGKYDIASSFEWYYQPYYVQISATVDPDGTTHVLLDTVAWGTETLLARMFYWGNVSYRDNYLDSTKARGWWGMELAWMEDLVFSGKIGAASFDFNLTSVVQYHFQLLAAPGADGFLNRVNDTAYWTWGPILSDYTDNWSPKHTISELERYVGLTYLHATPGSQQYNQSRPYDYPPIRWGLAAGQTWHFDFPTGNVLFYDPNLTPIGVDPTTGQYVETFGRFVYDGTKPAGYGTWDAAAMTWDVIGPSSPGGPVGSPGPDGTPGTGDDEYALEPWGAIRLAKGALGLMAASAPSLAPSLFGSWVGSAAPQAAAPVRAITTSVLVAPARSEPTSRRIRE